MHKRKQLMLLTVATLTLAVSNAALADTVEVKPDQMTVQNAVNKKANLLTIITDGQGRPVESRFIGNDANQLGKRSQSNPPNPANLNKWTNQKLNDNSYLWNRGHLVGDQFAGHASNNRLNLVGETVYLNQTLMTYYEGGMRSSNANALDNWLYLHPNYYIDYRVHVNWGADDELYPRSVTLQYRGLDKQGSPIEIKLPQLEMDGAGRHSVDGDGFTWVTIENIQPGYSIDYKTGRAVEDTSSVSNTDQATKDAQTNSAKEDQDLSSTEQSNQDLENVRSNGIDETKNRTIDAIDSQMTQSEKDFIAWIRQLVEDGVRAFVSAITGAN